MVQWCQQRRCWGAMLSRMWVKYLSHRPWGLLLMASTLSPRKIPKRGIIWSNLIYYARHIILNKQKGKPQAPSFSSYKGFLSISWVERANVVESVNGCSTGWEFLATWHAARLSPVSVIVSWPPPLKIKYTERKLAVSSVHCTGKVRISGGCYPRSCTFSWRITCPNVRFCLYIFFPVCSRHSSISGPATWTHLQSTFRVLFLTWRSTR